MYSWSTAAVGSLGYFLSFTFNGLTVRSHNQEDIHRLHLFPSVLFLSMSIFFNFVFGDHKDFLGQFTSSPSKPNVISVGGGVFQ